MILSWTLHQKLDVSVINIFVDFVIEGSTQAGVLLGSMFAASFTILKTKACPCGALI
jgi:hypothetical protein